MSIGAPHLRHLAHNTLLRAAHPIASSSRLTVHHPYPPFEARIPTAYAQSLRHSHALAQPSTEPSGFEGIPAAAYAGPVDGKGKEKAVEGAPSRRRADIKAKKSAITMVSFILNYDI